MSLDTSIEATANGKPRYRGCGFSIPRDLLPAAAHVDGWAP